ncbi:unnamed protein product [Adineta ricciae]|uniref:HTH CENPB-type domain-containing protein n=1 Tax=Adineta ricciae TaxID=249248 RepID=A0A815QDC8_ADIRI|nr:unnamed protein product [Adineta ricciae]
MSTIAVAGLGDVAKYVVEELNALRSPPKIVLLSREIRSWFDQQPNTIFRITDYSVESLTKHLTDVDVLISLIHSNDRFYNDVHEAMIKACQNSSRCKRFIPSECGGDIEKFPQHPEFYVPTHGAIRKLLEEQNEIEYTLFNQGWFMDYFIPADRSYMKRILPIWPLDLENETLRIPGTGNEPITFTATSASTVTHRECEVADLLCSVLESITSSHSHTFEVETTLDHELVDNELIDDVECEDTAEEASDPNWNDENEDENEEKALCKRFSLDYMTKAVEFYDEINPQTGKRKRRWETVKHKFRRIPHQIYLSRFRRYLEKHGTKKQKLDKIDDYVFDMFERARQKALPVHDLDLRRWALKQAMDESLHNFAASKHWLCTFKHKHNIVSRKITKIVTKHHVEDEGTIRTSADQFVADVRRRLPQYQEHAVLNTDQSGIQLEFHSTRTLSHQGEKVTTGSVRSVNATTHSYTAQPTITLDGYLLSPLYLCLKEPTGRLSDNIRLRLFKASNVVITCSSSGKLTTSLVEYWRDHVLLPSLGKHQKFLLISDCWPGQTDGKGLYDHIPGCTRLEIPKKTTDQIQPLDVFFNRQMKVIPRRLYDRVLLDELDINMSERNNIICLMSLTHNQLSAKVFFWALYLCFYHEMNRLVLLLLVLLMKQFFVGSIMMTLNYDTNISSNNSLEITNLPGLADQIAKTYSISRNMVRIFSARFIQSLILKRRKRQSTSITNDTNIQMKTVLIIEVELIYPHSCNHVKICHDRYITGILNTIQRTSSSVAFTISLSNNITLNLVVTFQSFDRTTSTTTATSTIPTTITSTTTAITPTSTIPTTITSTTTTITTTTTSTTMTTTTITSTTTTTTTTTIIPGWALATGLRVQRAAHADLLLTDGKVLVSGGFHATDTLRSTEIYDPVNKTWKDTGITAEKRRYHTIVLLNNGNILTVGGLNSVGSYLASTELLNLISNSWSLTGTMALSRAFHTTTKLADGNVLVAGGRYSSFTNTAELYNSTTGTWTFTGNMTGLRIGHIAVLLTNGKVLIAGGLSSATTFLNTAELYDPITGTWTATATMNNARNQPSAHLLMDGKVLVVGGQNSLAAALKTAEIYDPTTGIWTMVSNMTMARYIPRGSVLKNGKVLITGATNENGTFLNTAELYDPITNTWTMKQSMSVARNLHTSTVLEDGRVIVTGGGDGVNIFSSVEIYTYGD